MEIAVGAVFCPDQVLLSKNFHPRPGRRQKILRKEFWGWGWGSNFDPHLQSWGFQKLLWRYPFAESSFPRIQIRRSQERKRHDNSRKNLGHRPGVPGGPGRTNRSSPANVPEMSRCLLFEKPTANDIFAGHPAVQVVFQKLYQRGKIIAKKLL